MGSVIEWAASMTSTQRSTLSAPELTEAQQRSLELLLGWVLGLWHQLGVGLGHQLGLGLGQHDNRKNMRGGEIFEWSSSKNNNNLDAHWL